MGGKIGVTSPSKRPYRAPITLTSYLRVKGVCSIQVLWLPTSPWLSCFQALSFAENNNLTVTRVYYPQFLDEGGGGGVDPGFEFGGARKIFSATLTFKSTTTFDITSIVTLLSQLVVGKWSAFLKHKKLAPVSN